MNKYVKWVTFALVVILAIASQIFIQQRYTSLFSGGVEYQWPVTLMRENRWVPSDYLTVNFLGNHALWTGDKAPIANEEIYVLVNARKDGLLVVHSAGLTKPKTGLFIKAYAKKYENNMVEFSIPFNRAKVNLDKVNPKFYQNYKGVILATIKLEDGKGVITGLYSKGESIETAIPASLSDQAKQAAKVNVVDQVEAANSSSQNTSDSNTKASQVGDI